MINRSDEKWQQVINKQEASYVNISEHCKAHNIIPSTVYLQLRKHFETSEH